VGQWDWMPGDGQWQGRAASLGMAPAWH